MRGALRMDSGGRGRRDTCPTHNVGHDVAFVNYRISILPSMEKQDVGRWSGDQRRRPGSSMSWSKRDERQAGRAASRKIGGGGTGVSCDVGEAPVLYQRTLGATAGGLKKPKMRKEKRKEKKNKGGR
jgi:hypothetical protein